MLQRCRKKCCSFYGSDFVCNCTGTIQWQNKCWKGFSHFPLNILPACLKNSNPKLFQRIFWMPSLLNWWLALENLPLHKVPWFHLFSWYGNFVDRHSFCIALGDSPKIIRRLCLSIIQIWKESKSETYRKHISYCQAIAASRRLGSTDHSRRFFFHFHKRPDYFRNNSIHVAILCFQSIKEFIT